MFDPADALVTFNRYAEMRPVPRRNAAACYAEMQPRRREDTKNTRRSTSITVTAGCYTGVVKGRLQAARNLCRRPRPPGSSMLWWLCAGVHQPFRSRPMDRHAARSVRNIPGVETFLGEKDIQGGDRIAELGLRSRDRGGSRCSARCRHTSDPAGRRGGCHGARPGTA